MPHVVPPGEKRDWILERVTQCAGRALPGAPLVFDDTTEFMAIDRDHLVELRDRLFLVNGHERERRFTMDGEPKFWVKRTVCLQDGRPYLLKMVFQERFRARVGAHEFLCVRSAEKEARVLDLVRGDARFMQGWSTSDAGGNLVRVLKPIGGPSLMAALLASETPHEQYFRELFPGVLSRALDSFRAIERLHAAGLCHGDIRNDHLYVDETSGAYRWIDFDLDQGEPLFDVLSAGNVLHFVVARGFLSFRDAMGREPALADRLAETDGSVFFPHRVMNLRAVYPYVPERLNAVLLRFSGGAGSCYASMRSLADDLEHCLEVLA